MHKAVKPVVTADHTHSERIGGFTLAQRNGGKGRYSIGIGPGGLRVERQLLHADGAIVRAGNDFGAEERHAADVVAVPRKEPDKPISPFAKPNDRRSSRCMLHVACSSVPMRAAARAAAEPHNRTRANHSCGCVCVCACVCVHCAACGCAAGRLLTVTHKLTVRTHVSASASHSHIVKSFAHEYTDRPAAASEYTPPAPHRSAVLSCASRRCVP